MKEVGHLWNNITEPQISHYKKLARDDLERYHTDHQNFIKKINDMRKQAFANQRNETSIEMVTPKKAMSHRNFKDCSSRILNQPNHETP